MPTDKPGARQPEKPQPSAEPAERKPAVPDPEQFAGKSDDAGMKAGQADGETGETADNKAEIAAQRSGATQDVSPPEMSEAPGNWLLDQGKDPEPENAHDNDSRPGRRQGGEPKGSDTSERGGSGIRPASVEKQPDESSAGTRERAAKDKPATEGRELQERGLPDPDKIRRADHGDLTGQMQPETRESPPDEPRTPERPVSYERPSGYRKGVREAVWEKAKTDGKVFDHRTGTEISADEPWEMAQHPDHKFSDLQRDAAERGISRKQFLDEYNDPKRFIPQRLAPESQGDSERTYERPSGFRRGVREKVWENARNADGEVRDPLTGEAISPNEPWDMGHREGYEFRKHKESARRRGISREQFLDEYNNPEHYRPELPKSNRCHKLEIQGDTYYGD